MIQIAQASMKRTIVLLIDGSTNRQCRICTQLFREGYQPLFAGTLAEAGNVLKTAPVDAVILNETLPDGDGLEFIRRINSSKDARGSYIPSILLTTKATGGKITGAWENGCAECLDADADADVICAYVSAMLPNKAL